MAKKSRKNYSKRKGGMIKNLVRPLKPIGESVMTIGKEYGKDYLQKKSVKIGKTIYNDPLAVKDPNLYITGRKSPSSFSSNQLNNLSFNVINKDMNSKNIIDSENINPNIIKPIPIHLEKKSIGGKSKKHKQKKIKTCKNKYV